MPLLFIFASEISPVTVFEGVFLSTLLYKQSGARRQYMHGINPKLRTLTFAWQVLKVFYRLGGSIVAT